MKVERVVVDTNVLISALLNPKGTPRTALDSLARDGASLLFTNETFAEVAVRLAKPKFDRYRSTAQMELFLDWLADIGEWVIPVFEVTACRDPDDNKFLELVLAGRADCLLTGDQDLLVLNPFEDVPVMSPRDFTIDAIRK